ncbi:hypothetical protein WDW86_05440 [Bdellovibrionota bacterium FG-2]
MSNRSKEVIFEIPPSFRFSANWEKAVNSAIAIGANLTVTGSSRPYFLFEEPGSIIPELSDSNSQPQITGMAFLRAKL